MIRPARPEDAEAVVRVYRESRAEAMPWLPVLHTEEEDVNWYRDRLRGQAFVYELDGRVVGFAVVREGDLDALYVSPRAQRQGVGSALFGRIKEIRPQGFAWWVFRENHRARAFYEAQGGRFLHETDGANNEEKTPDARYEWKPSVDESSHTRIGV